MGIFLSAKRNLSSLSWRKEVDEPLDVRICAGLLCKSDKLLAGGRQRAGGSLGVGQLENGFHTCGIEYFPHGGRGVENHQCAAVVIQALCCFEKQTQPHRRHKRNAAEIHDRRLAPRHREGEELDFDFPDSRDVKGACKGDGCQVVGKFDGAESHGERLFRVRVKSRLRRNATTIRAVNWQRQYKLDMVGILLVENEGQRGFERRPFGQLSAIGNRNPTGDCV